MLYVIHCVDKADAGALRADTRDAHIAYLNANTHRIVLAGATLTDDGATPTGSHFIVNVADRAEAESFADGDPFTKAGLFARVDITRMRKGFWFPDTAEGA